MSGLVVARTIAELDEALGQVRESGPVSLVPTMGALHDGHALLLEQASSTAPALVVSIFVNPTQFGPDEDFDVYPRAFDDDLVRCEKAGASVVFAPQVGTMYPQGPDAAVVGVDPGPLGRVLEGAARPTHFRGVLTVVAKLLGLVRPDVAIFGEKDFQQLVLVRQMARSLAMRVGIVGAPTVREADGLAMSSRNRFLTPDQHEQATALLRALRAGAAAAGAGAETVLAEARAVLESAEIRPDYLALTDDELGEPEPGREARLLVAARIGSTRLIDNHGLVLGS